MKQPVLVLGFNRPTMLAAALQRLTDLADDRRVYVSIDGPPAHQPAMEERVMATREVAREFVEARENWILRLSPTNHGCRRGVAQAISWAFEHEDALIIMEDDIVPTTEFFDFCDQGLLRFAKNPTIGSLTGYSTVPPEHLSDPKQQCRLSYFPGSWGWATWKSRWSDFDIDNNEYRRVIPPVELRDANSRIFWRVLGQLMSRKLIDTWDYPWLFAHWQKGWKVLVPQTSLTSNCGFGVDATHTKEVPPGARVAETDQLHSLGLHFDLDNAQPELDVRADAWSNTVANRANIRTALALIYRTEFPRR